MTCVACTGSSSATTTFCGQCGGRVGATPSDPLLGTALDGRFLIESKIASGGFGTVYRARSLEAGCENQLFAIKVLLAQHSNDPSVSARFRREAVAMSSLANRHTVTTYELGEDQTGTRFIVMELLEGESLQERYANGGAMYWRAVLGIVRAACESLAEAHGLGIVHRDLKPANLFLCKQPVDFVKVLDFGIAKILNGSNMHDGAELTRIGQAIGTLEYMSPEQLIGGSLDNRTDIFTLGVVAYEMIVGHRPFSDVTGATGLVTALMTRRPPPPSTLTRGLPPGLDGILLRCLERDAQDRYSDVRELAHAIDRLLDAKDEMNSTQRQWGSKVGSKVPPRAVPMMADDQEDEITRIDVRPAFDSKPPVDDPKPSITPRSAAAMADVPVYVPSDPNYEAAVRAQLQPGDAIAPRNWRAQGTGVPFTEDGSFDLSDSSAVANQNTGARPLYATQWAIGTEATVDAIAVPRFPVGSSPVIDERPVLQPGGTVAAEPVLEVMPPPARLSAWKLALWSVGLISIGLGIGAVIATLAS